jgi:HTH-type transcriptional regulator/antitoxin HigA
VSIKSIKTEEDYHQALNRLEIIFDAKPETREGDELKILSVLIHNYENSQDTIDLPAPIEAIKFRMEQNEI